MAHVNPLHIVQAHGQNIIGKDYALVEAMLLNKQTGFSPGHGSTDQVLALTIHTEVGLQQKLKTGSVFLLTLRLSHCTGE